MFLAWLTFLTGIAVSVIAIYYSVLGLAAIFAAAVLPIVIMGSILEVAKLVTAWWLKVNWYRAPLSIKIYLLPAVIMLMLITSMGIFGFLSKAHTDQAVPLGDTASQVAFIDEKINNERETIANARNLIKQLDDAVIGIQSGQGREIRNRDGSVTVENPAERALQIRRAQARDRATLTQTIEEAQARIVKLQEEKAPIAGKLRAVEAEVGPIKYIAKLIYGDNPDQNLLERAVVWVIIIIVLVFDPLAVLLLLASQMSFQWARTEKQERENELVQTQTTTQRTFEEKIPPSESSDRNAVDGDRTEREGYQKLQEEHRDVTQANQKINDIIQEQDLENTMLSIEQVKSQEEKTALDDWNAMIAEAEAAAEKEKESANKTTTDEDIDDESAASKYAMQQWKADHPNDSLKHQKYLYKAGMIDKLPWDDYVQKESTFETDPDAEEAAKWALEKLEEKKKDLNQPKS